MNSMNSMNNNNYNSTTENNKSHTQSGLVFTPLNEYAITTN